MRFFLSIILSGMILYHLAAVIVLPNSSSLLGRKTAGFFLPYANTLGFNTSWQFFSPGPSPMFYLEYFVEFDREGNESEVMPYPLRRVAGSWSDSYNRRLFGMRFFSLNPDRLERYLAPFLCRQHPGAVSISVQPVYEPIQSIDRAGDFSDFRDMRQRVDFPRQRFSCPDPSSSHEVEP
jgi:hypothetical protein